MGIQKMKTCSLPEQLSDVDQLVTSAVGEAHVCSNTSGPAKERNRLDSSVRLPSIMLSDGSDKNSIASQLDTLPIGMNGLTQTESRLPALAV